MVISRMQLVKELEPGLNALFGLEYDRYENQHTEIFDTENSDRAFEEEVMLGGFANAAVKPEGQGIVYGDGKELFATDHPTLSGDQKNELSTAADLNETSLEQMLIDIADMKDERGMKIALQGTKMIIPLQLQFVAERLLKSAGRVGTADNDLNAVRNMGMVPQGYVVNNFLTDTDAFFIKTDSPNGLKHFVRAPIRTAMEGDFDTGNVRYKARERYSFGFSDWRGIFGSPGA